MIEFADIIGQDSAVSRLQRYITGGRGPHAYLFAGPTGVGRRTTALALARLLLCPTPVSVAIAGRDEPVLQACGQCPSCRMLAAGTHSDLHLIYKELARYHEDAAVRNSVMQSLSIHVIREFLINASDRASGYGRGRVFIVLEAELMSTEAQNCLLKTLEEPPQGSTIILICRNAEQMLPTTLSRCSVVRFGPLARDFVSAKLIEQGVDAGEADFWAAYTNGSIGRAMKLASQGFYQVKRDVLDRLGAMGPAGDADLGVYLAKLTDKLATAAVAEAQKAGGANLSKTLASRQAAGTTLELIASAFRDALHQAVGAESRAIHSDQTLRTQALADRFNPMQLADIIDQISRYERLLWRNVNPKTVWDNAAITFATAMPLRTAAGQI